MWYYNTTSIINKNDQDLDVYLKFQAGFKFSHMILQKFPTIFNM